MSTTDAVKFRDDVHAARPADDPMRVSPRP